MKGVARTVRDVDRRLFNLLFRVKWTPLTPVMKWATRLGTAGFVWGVTAGVAFLFSGPRLVNLLVPWFAIALSWLIAEGSKYLFNRARPFLKNTEIEPLIRTPSSSSFPSGHSATAAAGAITLSILYPLWAPLFLPGGLIIAFSRIYLGVHYPLDVLAGALIGAAVAAVLLLIFA
ncbi:phosphatase PAP2 family protein [Rubrobacter taiwanensis]|uniref:phosphatase PAP2 family protein n=1 Tax=Rubrobacter taiwanensis TaxID=185139 RepID=UPI001404A94B|nr:phosphatase PAP2 family protein [Rubrobacter taiwanensis]